MRQLIAQRLFGLVLGHENLNDHDELRDDCLLALAGDELTGENRVRERDRGHPLARTLNRLEPGEPGEPGEPDLYKKIVADMKGMDSLKIDLFLEAPPPKVSFLSREREGAQVLYEDLHCACGENGIKERQPVRRPDVDRGPVRQRASILRLSPAAGAFRRLGLSGAGDDSA